MIKFLKKLFQPKLKEETRIVSSESSVKVKDYVKVMDSNAYLSQVFRYLIHSKKIKPYKGIINWIEKTCPEVKEDQMVYELDLEAIEITEEILRLKNTWMNRHYTTTDPTVKAFMES